MLTALPTRCPGPQIAYSHGRFERTPSFLMKRREHGNGVAHTDLRADLKPELGAEVVPDPEPVYDDVVPGEYLAGYGDPKVARARWEDYKRQRPSVRNAKRLPSRGSLSATTRPGPKGST